MLAARDIDKRHQSAHCHRRISIGVEQSYHGLPDAFCGWYGTVHDIRKRIGLDPSGIRAAAEAVLAGQAPAKPDLSNLPKSELTRSLQAARA